MKSLAIILLSGLVASAQPSISPLIVPEDTNVSYQLLTFDLPTASTATNIAVYVRPALSSVAVRFDLGRTNVFAPDALISALRPPPSDFWLSLEAQADGLTSQRIEEFHWPPVVDKFITLTLQYLTNGVWGTRASRTYTNIPNQYWRLRNGPKDRAWQQTGLVDGPWVDIAATLTPGTNPSPSKFLWTNWQNTYLVRSGLPQ